MSNHNTMLGAVLYGAKDLRLEQCPTPEPGPGQALIRVRRAGICGSDMHYFEYGYCAAFVPTQPFILGHELVGEIAALGEGAQAPPVGARVVVNPARACGVCDYCRSGRGNLCRRTVFLGSASTTPPTDGAFAHFVAVGAEQCHVIPREMDDGLAAMMEPFAVALHAASRAGAISGKSVLVMGGGPIGLLVALTARIFGATPIALSDLLPARREKALTFGADAVLDPASASIKEQVRELSGDGFDAIFEASGAPAALRLAFDLVRPGGVIVQIGTLGTQDIPLPANQLMVREIQFVGSFRYGDVFGQAVRLAASGRANLQPLISQVFPLDQVSAAMNQALAKESALKVHLQVSDTAA